jgi:uncharacterized protein with beta-barrel porin domain
MAARGSAMKRGQTVRFRLRPASACGKAASFAAAKWHARLRHGVILFVALILTSAINDHAAAQFGPPPCTSNCGTPVNGSGFASTQGGLFDIGSHFQTRLSAQMSYRDGTSAGNNPQGGGADSPADRYRTWFEGYGISSKTDAQGLFLGDHRKVSGGIAGFGATVTQGLTLGVSVDAGRTNIDVPGATGRVDLTQIGLIGNFEHGPWNLGVTGIYGFGNVKSDRFDTGGISSASYLAHLWGTMAELSYYVALPNNSRFVPKLTADWLQTHTDSFAESGGNNPVSGSAVTASRIRMMVGGEIGHSWLVGRQIFDFAVYGRLVNNLAQNIGDLAVSNPGASGLQLVAGIRESSMGADAGAAFSVKVSPLARLYAAYDGRFRGNLTSHSGSVGAEFRF